MKKVPIGSREQIKASNKKFNILFDEMIELIGEGRTIEFRIRLISELAETAKFFD